MPCRSLSPSHAGAPHRLAVARRGIAATEFAISAAFLVLAMTALYDFGRASWRKLEVTAAAQAGAVYAAANGMNITGITAAIAAATNTNTITATPAPTMSCGCPNGTSGITPTACNATCPGTSNPAQLAGYYATISARGSYTFMFRYPYVTSPLVISARTVLKLQ